jgi:hypothetical protein
MTACLPNGARPQGAHRHRRSNTRRFVGCHAFWQLRSKSYGYSQLDHYLVGSYRAPSLPTTVPCGQNSNGSEPTNGWHKTSFRGMENMHKIVGCVVCGRADGTAIAKSLFVRAQRRESRETRAISDVYVDSEIATLPQRADSWPND